MEHEHTLKLLFKDGSRPCQLPWQQVWSVTPGLLLIKPQRDWFWTRRKRSESHALLIQERLNRACLKPISLFPCQQPGGNQVTAHLLMTDGDKNVKNRMVMAALASAAVFLTSLNYRSLCAVFFSSQFSRRVFSGTERKKETSSRLWKGLSPANHPFNNRCQRKEVHKSINLCLRLRIRLEQLRVAPCHFHLRRPLLSWKHIPKTRNLSIITISAYADIIFPSDLYLSFTHSAYRSHGKDKAGNKCSLEGSDTALNPRTLQIWSQHHEPHSSSNI